MIKIILFYDSRNLVALRINGHAPDYICAGVSVLALNTINCIEKFTHDKFFCDYNKNGGMIDFKFLDHKISHDACLLIKTLEFGLKDIYKTYKNFIKIQEVNKNVWYEFKFFCS